MASPKAPVVQYETADRQARGLDWRRPWSSSTGSALLLTVIVLAGLVVRLYLSPRIPLDSDEAIVGLMGRHILLQGERPVFYWDHSFTGAVNAYFAAAAYSLVGFTVFAIRIGPIALSVIFCYLVYLLGTRLYDRRVGLVSALYLSFPPLFLSSWYIRAEGAYTETLVFGVATLLLLDDITYRGRLETWRLALFGLLAGIAAYVGQTVLPVLVVAALFVVLRLGLRAARVVLLSAPAFVVGALPLLLWNVQNSFGTISGIMALEMNGPANGGLRNLPHNLARLAADAMPSFLGFIGPTTDPVIFGQLRQLSNVYWDLGLLATAGLAILAIHWLVTTRPPWLRGLIARRDSPLVALMVVEVLLFALSSTAQLQVGEPRYLLAMFIAAPFFFAYLVRLGERSRLATAAILLAVVAVNLRSTIPTLLQPKIVYPNPAVQTLLDRGETRIWADYWVAYVLDLESDERITAATVAVGTSSGVWVADNRYDPYLRAVESAASPPFAFLAGSPRDVAFQQVLAQKGIRCRRVVVGGIAIYDDFQSPVPVAR